MGLRPRCCISTRARTAVRLSVRHGGTVVPETPGTTAVGGLANRFLLSFEFCAEKIKELLLHVLCGFAGGWGKRKVSPSSFLCLSTLSRWLISLLQS